MTPPGLRQILRRLVRASLYLTLAVSTVLAVTETVFSMHEPGRAAHVSKSMKTVCVGRFLIDVPADAEVTLFQTEVGGLKIASVGAETRAEFDTRILQRAIRIHTEENGDNLPSMEAVHAVQGMGIEGTAFVYNRRTGSYVEDAAEVTFSTVAFEAHVHRDGFSFDFVTEGIDPVHIGHEMALVSQIEPLAATTLPTKPGFCLDGALLRDPIGIKEFENIVMLVGFPGHPDIGMSLSTMAGTQTDEGLLARNEANKPIFDALSLAFKMRMTTLVAQTRALNGLSGDELVFKTREMNFTTGYAFAWEHQGDQKSVTNPSIEMMLQAGNNPRAGGPPLQASMAQADLFDLWQRITGSLRLRPVSKQQGQPGDKDQPHSTPPLAYGGERRQNGMQAMRGWLDEQNAAGAV